MPRGSPGSSAKGVREVKIHEQLITDIRNYTNAKYPGSNLPLTQASLIYARDMKTIKERLNSKGGNNFL